jgi:hypothetical protein
MPELPARLRTPPSSAVTPPVTTRVQQLEFQKLTWDDFQRLLVRIAEAEAQVEHCQEYGVQGQEQQGIDLYARRSDGTYEAYQCRRVQSFGPADLGRAVADFCDGSWASRAKRFVVATSFDTNRFELAEALEGETAKLRETGVALELWGRDQLSARLKGMPEVVDDFFGRAWVVAFCGQDAADRLGERLDHGDVLEYRRRLRDLFQSVFRQHDPGIPLQQRAGLPVVPLEDRFVPLDVLAEHRLIRGTTEARPPEDDQSASSTPPPVPVPSSIDMVRYVNRRDLDGWLASSDRSVIVAEAGAGKSTVLRFVALDLLSDAPRFTQLAARWGDRLPVWLPFGFWTRAVANGVGMSLGGCLHHWLEQQGQAALWPLVQRALADRRLLLLVDGLDEWTTEDAARIARDLLQVFVDQQRAAAVVSTRPYGYARVPITGEGWQVGRLAPLSPSQQRDISTRWFVARHRVENDGRDPGTDELARLDAEVERFLRELEGVSELRELAAVPLMLMLLLYLRFQHVALPRGRFEVYARLVEHLLRVHPDARRSAALVVGSEDALSEEELRGALGALAFIVQQQWPQGVLRDTDIPDVARTALEMTGMASEEVRRYTTRFIEVVQGRLGVVISEGDQVFFLHRAIQEYLAAEHAASLPLAEQRTLLQEFIDDPRWRDVLRAMLVMVRRSEEVAELIGAVVPPAAENDVAVAELRAEVAFGEYRCPPALAATIAAETFRRIETHPVLSHRESLLGHVFAGLRPSRTRELVRDKLRRWSVASKGWRAGPYGALARWPATEETIDTLWAAMHDEEAYVCIEAAKALATCAGGLGPIGERLRATAIAGLSPDSRAVALFALALGWPDIDVVSIAQTGRASVHAPLRIASILARVKRGVPDDDDLVRLVELSSDWAPSLGWSGLLTPLLIEGWPGSKRLRAAALDGIRNRSPRGEHMDNAIAWGVLLPAFPGDQEVAALCVEQLKVEHPFIGMLFGDVYSLLAVNFRGDANVIAAVEEWAQRQTFHEMELSRVSSIGPTPAIKAILLRHLESSSFPHWPVHALLEGWGMTDDEVGPALRTIATGDAPRASRIAYLIPRILTDPEEARTRLVALLRAPDNQRPDFVLSALSGLPHAAEVDDEIVALALARIAKVGGLDGTEALIQGWPRHPRVRAFALEQLEQPEAPIASIAWAYADDADMRAAVAALLTPLPRRLRQRILETLTDLESEADLALGTLKRFRQEDDAEVATTGSIGFHSRIRDDPDAAATALALLREEIHATGPHYEGVRQAALAGLVVLGKFDEIQKSQRDADAMEFVIKPWEPNVPLLRLLAQHWPELRSALGQDPLAKLSASGDAWQSLALVAEASPALRDELIGIIESGTLAPSPETLQFLANVRPGSDLLLDRCLRALQGGSTENPFRAGQLTAVATIFTQQFAQSDRARERLLAPYQKRGGLSIWYEGTVLALVAAWPDDPLVDSLYAELQQEPPVSAWTGYAVLYAKLPVAELANRLRRHLERAAAHPYLLGALRPAVAQRLARDGAARIALIDALREDAEPSLKASVPRLLASVGALSENARRWCAAELQRQAQRTEGSEIGLDLMAEEARTLSISLQEALGVEPR